MALVLLVWGMIGYKFINGINPTIEAPQEIALNEKFIPKKEKDREYFEIVADYRDPFLGTIKTPKTTKKKSATKKVKKEVPKKDIRYTGFITDKSNNQKIFFVSVDGDQQMMSLNDTFKEVKLQQGNKEFIKVLHNGKSNKILLIQ